MRLVCSSTKTQHGPDDDRVSSACCTALMPRMPLPDRICSCLNNVSRCDAGVTAALAHIFKAGLRRQLLAALPAVWPAAMRLPASPVAASNVLARKLAVKLAQRMGLALLPPRSAAWAHSAAVTSLADTLQSDAAAAAAAAEAGKSSASGAAAACVGQQRGDTDDGNEHDEGVPEELEQVIQVLTSACVCCPLCSVLGRLMHSYCEDPLTAVSALLRNKDPQARVPCITCPPEHHYILNVSPRLAVIHLPLLRLRQVLLTALRDRDTVVRWSGAKGLARVTARLPQNLGTDVIDCVLDLFGATGDGGNTVPLAMSKTRWMTYSAN